MSTVETNIRALYVKSPNTATDDATLLQLRAQAPELDVTVADTGAAALAEIRRTSGWHALLLSPALPQNETLALIASLRRDRVAIAIVPIIDEVHQDVFASAVASGADDVLLRRGQALINVPETLTRIRQSPHLFPAEQRRRITVFYAGRDALVWNLLEQVPFVKAEKAQVGSDGTCPVRASDAPNGSMLCDAVVIDEQPGEAHPLQVLKSVKAQASDLPVVVLTSTATGDIATAALELGADDTVQKTGIFRRRLIATLRRVHQRLEITTQQAEIKAREERLRHIVETVPTGITVIGGDGVILAMNAAALGLFGAKKPRDVVGRDFRQVVSASDHDTVTTFIQRVTSGDPASTAFTGLTLDGTLLPLRVDGVVLERDARGGRGVVAAISPVTAAPRADASPAAGELDNLRDSLERTERHYAELEDVRARERAGWDDERRELETRLEAAERLAAERETLGVRLADVSAELTRTAETAAREREALETRLQALEATAAAHESAGAMQVELAGTLESVREELRQALAAHAIERASWQTVKEDLEARLRDVDAARAAQADQAAGAATLQLALEEARLLVERERQATADRHTVLETELRHAREALWAEHGERDATRQSFERELGALRQTIGAEREAWATTQATSQQDLQHAQDQIAQQARELAETQAERDAAQQRALAAIDGERHDWHTTRARLEDETRAARERVAALEAELATTHSQLDARQTEVHDALDAERRQWETERVALHQELRQAREGAEQAHRDIEVRCAALAVELDLARSTGATLQQALDAARGAHEGTQEALRQAEASLLDASAARARLEQDLDAARASHDAGRQIWDSLRAVLEDDLHRTRDLLSMSQGDWEASQALTTAELNQLRERAEAGERDRDLARASLDTERAQWAGSLEEERQRWNDARARVEEQARLAEEAMGDLQRQLEDARAHATAAVDAERQQLSATFDGERQQWERSRVAIEEQLRDALTRGDDLQRALDEARHQATQTIDAERQQLHTAFDGERQQWETSRLSLDEQLRQAHASIADLQRQLDDARQHAEHTLESERQQALARHAQIDAELQHSRAAVDAVQAQLEEEQARAGQRLDTERQAWEQSRAHLESELHAASAASHAWTDQRMSLEGLLRRAHEDLDSLQRELEATQAQLEQDREHVRTSSTRQQAEWDATRTGLEAALEAATQARAELAAQFEAAAAARDATEARLADVQALEVALDAARTEIRHTDEAHAAERGSWHAERDTLETQRRELDAAYRALEARLADADHAQAERQRLTDALDALRTDYAAMVHTLATEKAERDRAQREIDTLRATIAEAHARRAELDRQVADAARAVEDRVAHLNAQHATRIRDLEQELLHAAQRLARISDEATAARAALQAEYLQASESHNRLVSSDLFGYAVMTLPGELVRCNDAFARLFGFEDAPHALTRTAGQLFPGISGRTALAARLIAEGHVDRLESCLERPDGRPLRVIESASLLTDPHQSDDEILVEHIFVGAAAGPTADELQARRLEEVGALTSAMVPEIEALVATAHERGYELRRQLRDSSHSGGDVETLVTLTAQINALVRQLAAFSRRQLRQAESLDLVEAITRTEAVLVRLVGDYIGFSLRLAPTPPVIVLADDLDQLLTSLVTFCRDLLPAGGSLVIETRGPVSDSGAEEGDTPGRSAATVLSVTASGYGVQLPESAPAVELVARRCGGQLRLSGEAGWMVRAEVHFPRCGGTPKSGWNWSLEGN